MPTSQPPLLLIDNVFDRINQYASGVLTATATAPNRPVSKVADYRRERTYWQAGTVAAGHAISVDIGAGLTTAVDSVFLDRGHNLWGQSISIIGSDDNFATAPTNVTPAAVPALVAGQFVPGGDPTAGWAVTEEGAIYYIFPALTAVRRYWRLLFNTAPAAAHLVTGVILGKKTQLDSYSNVLDEDAGGRKRGTDESEAGYTAGSRVYPYRTTIIELAVIGATEYDTKIRLIRRAIFEKQIPLFVAMNFGRWPERGWLYTLDADRWASPTRGVHRTATIPLRELYAVIR
jgi:hypothetical protein